jgi:ribonucleoside-diphosphate reductase beta chain
MPAGDAVVRRRWRPHDPLALAPAQLAELSAASVAGGVEAALAQRLAPERLFERWERSRWSAGEIDLSADRRAWREQASPGFRAQLRTLVEKLVIGEFTAVDHVALVMAGAPDERYLAYLATQSADEAQHWRFVLRLAAEVLDVEADPHSVLASAWHGTTAGLRELTLHEADVARRLARAPDDYELWLQLVAIFHLLTEGVIATTGQRAVLRTLAQRGRFPGTQAGFAAFARDEGRHVSFGLHALREGIAAGHGEAIWSAVEAVAPAVVTVDVGPSARRSQRWLAERSGLRMLETLERRLRGIDALVAHVRERGATALANALAAARHGEPAR